MSSIRILPETLLTDEVFELLIGMVSDPEESWWVVDGALETVGPASADKVAPHVDAILPWLKHHDWWLQNSAIKALSPVTAHARCYRKIIPVLGKVISGNQHHNTLQHLPGIISNLQAADPEVQVLAAEQVPWDQLITRYRDVTLPKGMDNWYALDFDPARAGR